MAEKSVGVPLRMVGFVEFFGVRWVGKFRVCMTAGICNGGGTSYRKCDGAVWVG